MLRISKAAMLGLHALAFIATGETGEPVTAACLADRLGVSEAHLGKVLQRLAKQGLLFSRKGPIGGFSLARSPDRITLLQILEAIDGPSTRGHCVISGHAPESSECLVDNLFRAVYEQVHRSLATTSLSDGMICMPDGALGDDSASGDAPAALALAADA